MKILIIIGNCIKVNSSANLCHISYINGLLNNGHNVDLLTVNDKGAIIDKNIIIPNVDTIFEYNGSFYDRLHKKKNTVNNSIANQNIKIDTQSSIKFYIKKFISRIKSAVYNIYGVYGTNIIWYNNAKRFKSKNDYDLVISLSFPPVSHHLAIYLKNRKHVYAKKWIQIWEDPWSSDLVIHSFNGSNIKQKIEEMKLLDNASDILYVSPLTLKYQKELFPENASKMRWAPLPTYYQSQTKHIDFSELHFGYFGDYNSKVRNIEPFYNVAKNNNLNFTICGATDLTLESNDNISVYPRLPLSELSVHENKSNVLVFLCNLKGGQIPGKIYQYSATNKFILFILDGTDEEKTILKEYFSKFNRYVFCKNNESSIKAAIDYIKLNIDKKELYTAIDDFNPEKIIKQIIEG
ncbi:MAG: hypothetical protein IKV76_08755 [Clostridia bacterium]|nr:hypothetical protein [Clostridia bacterium]